MVEEASLCIDVLSKILHQAAANPDALHNTWQRFAACPTTFPLLQRTTKSIPESLTFSARMVPPFLHHVRVPPVGMKAIPRPPRDPSAFEDSLTPLQCVAG